ncbi:hypothetical protein GCM10022245_35620 [Streptomyces mayteni]
MGPGRERGQLRRHARDAAKTEDPVADAYPPHARIGLVDHACDIASRNRGPDDKVRPRQIAGSGITSATMRKYNTWLASPLYSRDFQLPQAQNLRDPRHVHRAKYA